MTDVDTRLAALEREVDRLRSEAEIVRIEYQYGYYLDNRMWTQAADLFTDEGSIEIGRRGVYQGKENVRRFMLEVLGGNVWGLGENEFANHVQLQPVVTVSDDGESARLRCRAMVIAHPTGEDTLLWAEGAYENTFRRVDGVWKLDTMFWAPTFYFPIAGYEARAGYLSAPPNEAFPPTAPSSRPIDPALGRMWVPFHYPHPFTGEQIEGPWRR